MDRQPDKPRSALSRVLGNAGLLLGGRTVNAVVSLAYMALAGRALGVQDFGALVLIHAFTQLMGDAVKFQSWQTLIQYAAAPLAEGRPQDVQRVIRFTLGLDLASGVLAALAGMAGAVVFSGALGWSPEQAPAAAIYALSSLFMTPATQIGVLRLLDRFDLLAAQAALIAIGRLVGCAIAAALNAPLEGFLCAWAFGTVLAFVVLTAGSLHALAQKDLLARFSWRGPLMRHLPGAWRFAWTTNLSSTIDMLFTHVSTLAVGGLLGAAPAALWRVGAQVGDAIAKPAKLLVPALYPELVRMRLGEGQGAMWRLALQTGILAGGLGVLLLSVALFAGGPLLALVMGEAFRAASTAMTWQVAAAVVSILALPLEPMLVSLGRPGSALRVRLAVCAVYLALLIPAVSRYGIHGAGALGVGAAVGLAGGMLVHLLRTPRNRGGT